MSSNSPKNKRSKARPKYKSHNNLQEDYMQNLTELKKKQN